MRGLTVLVLLLAGLLAGAVAILYSQGRQGLEAQERHLAEDIRSAQQAVLEGISKEVADSLQKLLEKEAERPYYHYQHLYVPPDAVSLNVALVPSPICDQPSEELIRYYFQYGPGGLSSPCYLPPADAQVLQQTPPTEYSTKIRKELVVLEGLTSILKEHLTEQQVAPPANDLIDNMICLANADVGATLKDLEDAPTNPSQKVQLENQWADYQSRQGQKVGTWGGSYNNRNMNQQDYQPRQKQQQQQKKVRTGEDIEVLRYPFVFLRQGRDAMGWPKRLVAVRRVDIGPRESRLQGFEVDLGLVRQRVLPGLIAQAESESSPSRSPGMGSGGSYGYQQLSAPLVEVVPTRPQANGAQTAWVHPAPADGKNYQQAASPAADPKPTLALLPPLDGVSLVYAGQTFDASKALQESRMLLHGALGLVGFVFLLGSVILMLAARGQSRLASQRADFVAALTHELKAPLTGIRALTELLHDGLVTDPTKKQEYYGSMLSECDRLSRLIQNVLAAARLERGVLKVVLEPVEPLSLLSELVGRFTPRLETAGFSLETELPDSLPQINADPESFRLVVTNLLDNAAKYGRGEENLVRLEARTGDGLLQVSVSDRGPGIPVRERQRVFQRFFRSPNAPREVGGAGLGLSIARVQARAQGGDLSVDENPGGGARFTFTLPLPRGGA